MLKSSPTVCLFHSTQHHCITAAAMGKQMKNWSVSSIMGIAKVAWPASFFFTLLRAFSWFSPHWTQATSHPLKPESCDVKKRRVSNQPQAAELSIGKNYKTGLLSYSSMYRRKGTSTLQGYFHLHPKLCRRHPLKASLPSWTSGYKVNKCLVLQSFRNVSNRKLAKGREKRLLIQHHPISPKSLFHFLRQLLILNVTM